MQATDVATILCPQSPFIYGYGWSSVLGRRLWVQAPGRGFFSSRYFQAVKLTNLNKLHTSLHNTYWHPQLGSTAKLALLLCCCTFRKCRHFRASVTSVCVLCTVCTFLGRAQCPSWVILTLRCNTVGGYRGKPAMTEFCWTTLEWHFATFSILYEVSFKWSVACQNLPRQRLQ